MSNNITLYSCEGTPNSIKITLTLEELGLKYAHQRVDITKNEQKQPWFLEINPNGRVGAIMLYLTDKYDDENKISYSHGTDEYYEMLSWLMFQMGGIGPMQVMFIHTYLSF
jgi:glutathione S-transferase